MASVFNNVSKNVSKNVSAVKIEANLELLADLRKLVNEPACSDVVFLCKDGERVQACRVLLVSRSKVLKCLLMNGMAESNSSEIEFPDIPSRVLLSVFEFLYTGDILDYPLLGWRMAFEVMSAARFFILPILEKIVEEFLVAQTSKVGKDLTQAALMLNEAMEFKSLCEEKDDILRQLVKILSPRLPPIYVDGLSADALDYLLTKTRSIFEDDCKFSFREYLRFRQVILWWICQCCQGDPQELVKLVVPDEKGAFSLIRDPVNADISLCCLGDGLSPSQDLNCALLDKTKRDIVVNLLSKIDWRCIPSVWLVKVVEPLNLISEGELLKAFRYHALHERIVFELPREIGWNHGGSYFTLEEGSLLQKCESSTGFAFASEAMSRPYGLYEWFFTIEEGTDTSCELGLIFTIGRFPVENLGFREALAHRNDARVMQFVIQSTIHKGFNWQGDSGHSWRRLEMRIQVGSTVRFKYNASDRNCSVMIDTKDYGVAWRNLPRAIYYPAVSLGSSRRGRVRINRVSGFDTF